MTSDTVSLPAQTVYWLVEYALDMLWASSRDGWNSAPPEGEGEGCCPRCCGACAALKTLLDDGLLDDLARSGCHNSFFWDTAADQVDRDWLARAWVLTGCHEGDDDAQS